jgi:hypothetical protein
MRIKPSFNGVTTITLIGISLYQTYLMRYPPLPVPSGSAVAATPATVSMLSNYWPLGLMVLLVALNHAASFWTRGEAVKGPALRGQLIVGSGNGQNFAVHQLNGKAVMDFRKDYKLLVVCGLVNPTVDKFEDMRIAKSAAFTIVPEVMEVVTPYSASMLETLNAVAVQVAGSQKQLVRPGFKQTKKNRRAVTRQVGFQYQTWGETVLLPNGVNPDDIHRLSDVRRYNGKILTEEIHEKRIAQTW